jgi:hypothetical protein
VRQLGIDRFEVFYVPGVNDLSTALGRASKQQGIVDAAARKSTFRGLLEGLIVFALVQADDRAAVANFLNEQQRLVGWETFFTGSAVMLA